MAQFLHGLLTASIRGSVVIVAVLFLRLVLRKTPKKFLCIMWLLVGLALLMPFEIRSDLSLQPEWETVTTVQWVEDVPVSTDTLLLPTDNDQIESIPVPSTPMPSQPSQGEVAQSEKADRTSQIFFLWLSVAGLFLLYTFWSYWKLKRQVREAVKIKGGWECDRIDTAFILGFLRPQIYIPMGLPESVRRHILAHERTHLEKGDHWFKMMGFLALAMHWFNPLVWVAYILMCRDMEMACDERVVQFMDLAERKEYSAALLTCSANRVYLAGPVAFGEVSVKKRIRAVLKYKRPGFWISLAGVIAIGFVAVCLVTSPEAEPEDTPEVQESTATTEETELSSTFAANLSEDEILDAVTAGIQELCSRESCRAVVQSENVFPNQADAGYTQTLEVYRYGQDVLLWLQSDFWTEKMSPMGSELYYGDRYADHVGDHWLWQGNRNDYSDPNDWIQKYSPEGKTVTAVRVESESTVSFDADWIPEWKDGVTYSGTTRVTFREDGTIAALYRKYQEKPPKEGKDAWYFEASVTVLEDPDPRETYRIISDYALQCLTEEDLEKVRQNRNTITEIPSNKTDYDQDLELGRLSRQWRFLDGGWHCSIGSENVTSNGLTLTFSESGDGHSAFAAEEGYWLETFDGSKWKLLKEPLELAPAEKRSISVSWETGDTIVIDWSESYGTLPEGYYRLGRYYTVTMADGSSETLHCYSKFQIRDQNVESLLQECKAGVSQLIEDRDYYIKVWNYLRNEEFHDAVDADSHDLVLEIWRCGEDYYKKNIYRYKSDGSVKSIREMLLRSGQGYDIEDGTVSPADWVEEATFTSWSNVATLFSATDIQQVWRDQLGTIHVQETTDFYPGIPLMEQRYSFTGDGTLVGYQKIFYNEAGEEFLDVEMERYRTAEGETGQKIDSIVVN